MSDVQQHGPRSCLLIVPRSFYAFAKVVEGGLQALGYETVVANDEYPEGTLGKIMSKLGLPLTRTITRRVLERRFLEGRRYDLVLIIKGRGLDGRIAELLARHASKVVGYHFDSFRYDRGPARWRRDVPRVCTFDYRDAAENGLEIVELFSSMPAAPAPVARRFRVSAIMRNHSERLTYLDRVMRAFGDEAAFIYIYEANLFSFVANFVRHPLLYLKYRRFISRKALPYAQYVEALGGSDFTIDYAHPSQTGITIRCFEALGAGTRIITNNRFVLQSRHFAAAQPIVFAPGADPAELVRSVRASDPRPPPALQRTVEDFLVELIGPAQGVASGHQPQPQNSGQPHTT